LKCRAPSIFANLLFSALPDVDNGKSSQMIRRDQGVSLVYKLVVFHWRSSSPRLLSVPLFELVVLEPRGSPVEHGWSPFSEAAILSRIAKTILWMVLRASMPMTGVGAFLCSLASGDTLPAGAFQMLTNDEFLPILCDFLMSLLFPLLALLY